MSPLRTMIVSWLLGVRPAFTVGGGAGVKEGLAVSFPGNRGASAGLSHYNGTIRNDPSGENSQVQGLTGQQGVPGGRPLPRPASAPETCSALISQSCFLCVRPSCTFSPKADRSPCPAAVWCILQSPSCHAGSFVLTSLLPSTLECELPESKAWSVPFSAVSSGP